MRRDLLIILVSVIGTDRTDCGYWWSCGLCDGSSPVRWRSAADGPALSDLDLVMEDGPAGPPSILAGPPAPQRSHRSWREFVHQHADQLLAVDFFVVDMVWLSRLHLLFFELGSCVHLDGCTRLRRSTSPIAARTAEMTEYRGVGIAGSDSLVLASRLAHRAVPNSQH